ncbi:putative methyltransferase-domain-containing protein [Podospora didyma]|uniref:Methyltransferase-domain-containing protein n=1 Tax=Podospora didyma TaxID=330526 RepID=A0AAE0NHU4_9PEZI|nr:putative methyltransferase-domain-containing protein [Podospora didyma]
MHYVRLLRLPSVEQASRNQYLSIVLTITTDLGDSFLSPAEPIDISVIAAYTALKDGQRVLLPLNLTPSNAPKWRAGMRALKIDIAMPPQPIETVQIRPSNRQLTALGAFDIYPPRPAGQGLIVAAYADIPLPHKSPPFVCFRSLRLSSAEAAPGSVLQVEEDIGDSIARHIWDAGILTVSLIADMCLRTTTRATGAPLPALAGVLRRQEGALNILELGCGIGTLGVGIARILCVASSSKEGFTPPYVLMTDLPDAEERARANIARALGEPDPSADATPSIEYEDLDWEDGKDGVFGEKVQARPWDLIVLSDCTYNDMLPTLVKTLSALHAHSTAATAPCGTKILLSTKPRHPSERAFFGLMSDGGWVIEEKTVVPLAVLNGEAESVEIYLFAKK